jgi:multiple sugar transport system substrate-binding protein
MKSKRLLYVLLVGSIVSALLGACAQPTAAPTEAPPPTQAPAPTQAMAEPTEAMPTEAMMPETMLEGDPTGQTVTWWHAFGTGANYEGVQAVVSEFNATNEWGITVQEASQGSQSDLTTAVNGAIATGELPNITMAFPNDMARWYQVGVIGGINDYIDDPLYGLSADDLAAFYPGSYSAGTLADGTQIGVPMHQSAEVIFYNNSWAQELGFPNPPQTSAEFKEQACAAAAANNADDNADNDGTGGYVYFPDASMVTPWVWAFDGDVLTADGTAYNWNSQAAVDVGVFFKDLVDSGCTLTTPSYPNPEFAGRLALFATSSSAGIPFQQAAMDDAGNADTWSAIAFPGPNGTQVVDAFGQLIGVVKTNPDQDLASWLFLRWLTSAEGQSLWLSKTTYFPSRSDVDVSAQAAADPVYAGALALLPEGKAEPNLPAQGALRNEIRDTYLAIVEAGSQDEIVTLLNGLNDKAAELVAESQ